MAVKNICERCNEENYDGESVTAHPEPSLCDRRQENDHKKRNDQNAGKRKSIRQIHDLLKEKERDQFIYLGNKIQEPDA